MSRITALCAHPAAAAPHVLARPAEKVPLKAPLSPPRQPVGLNNAVLAPAVVLATAAAPPPSAAPEAAGAPAAAAPAPPADPRARVHNLLSNWDRFY